MCSLPHADEGGCAISQKWVVAKPLKAKTAQALCMGHNVCICIQINDHRWESAANVSHSPLNTTYAKSYPCILSPGKWACRMPKQKDTDKSDTISYNELRRWPDTLQREFYVLFEQQDTNPLVLMLSSKQALAAKTNSMQAGVSSHTKGMPSSSDL